MLRTICVASLAVASSLSSPETPSWVTTDDADDGGDPMGAGWGYGCTYLCEDNFADIIDKFDDFST
jgi:hypothetical protein